MFAYFFLGGGHESVTLVPKKRRVSKQESKSQCCYSSFSDNQSGDLNKRERETYCAQVMKNKQNDGDMISICVKVSV